MNGILFAISLLSLSQSPTLIRFAAAPSLAICLWRLVLALLVLAPLALRRSHRRAFAALNRHDQRQLFLSGFFLFIHFYLFFRAVQETTVANSLIIYSINPLMTAIGAYFIFGEKVSLHLALAGLLGFSGVAVVLNGSLDSASNSLWGDSWALMSAVFFSGYLLTGKHVRRKLPNTSFAAAVYLQTAIYAAIAMVVLDVPFFSYDTQTWWAFAGLALFPTLLGHALFTHCLNFMNVNFMSCAKLIEPVLASVVAIWLFNEPLTPLSVIGFSLTATSVIVLYWEPLLDYASRTWRST